MKHLNQFMAFLLVGALLISLFSITANASSGDVNRDGNVDMKDVLLLRKHIANLAPCDDEAASDMNSDRSLDMKDVLLLRLFIVSGSPSDESSPTKTEIAKVIELVNGERAANGASPLRYNASMQEAADLRVNEIDVSFSHTRPDGTPCFTAIKELGIGYSCVGENIAYGYSTPEAVMEAWMKSDGHRKNILDPQFTDIAVGYDPATNCWVQLFLTP